MLFNDIHSQIIKAINKCNNNKINMNIIYGPNLDTNYKLIKWKLHQLLLLNIQIQI